MREPISPQSVLTFALGFGILAMVWYLVRKAGGLRDTAARALGAAADVASRADIGSVGIDALARASVDATSDPIEVLGRVVLPSGEKIPISGLQLRSGGIFDFRGVSYRLTRRRPDNDYDSMRI